MLFLGTTFFGARYTIESISHYGKGYKKYIHREWNF